MKIQELRKEGLERLKEYHIEDSSIKIDMLLQYLLNISKIDIIVNSEKVVSEEIKEKYFENLYKIIKGTPIQYITNKQEFMGHNFFVDENVLIPQPDTEILVEETIKVLKNKIESLKENDVIRILDICTGSGAIAVSLASYVEEHYKNNKIEIYATDISENALSVARKNMVLNTQESNIKFILSDMFEKVPKIKYDIIVSNPPYIETKVIKTLAKEVQSEPHIALDGGVDGLKYYRIIANNSYKFLKSEADLLLEIGYNQKENVTTIFEENKNYINIKCINDFSGNDRVIKMNLK